LTLSTLGFIAAGKVYGDAGWNIAAAQMVGPTTVSYLLPEFMLIAFSVMLLAGLCSTLDSILCAMSSMTVADFMKVGHISNDLDTGIHKSQVRLARFAMIVTAVIGFSIASIPNIKIIHLFLFYGTLRASTLIPTVLTLYWPRLNSRAVFYAILGSMIFGAPVMAIGQYQNNPHISVSGSLMVILIGTVACIGLSHVFSKMKTNGDNND
jgi:Na+/proline symporter